MSDRLQNAKLTARRLFSAKAITLAIVAALGYGLYQHPPVERIEPQQLGVRQNRWTHSATPLNEGLVLMLPGIHELQRYPLTDQRFRPERSRLAAGESPLHSAEGLPLGAEISIRYAWDTTRLASVAQSLPFDLDAELLEPLVQGVIHKQFAAYSAAEIIATKQRELEDRIATELKPLLARHAISLRQLQLGEIDLPSRFLFEEQVYQPERSSKAGGEAPLQSLEGLSLGAELTVRYTVDPARIPELAMKLPLDLNTEFVAPLVEGVIYKAFARYTVREIFSTKRQELEEVIATELKPQMAEDGIRLRSVRMGNVDLPGDYRAGMDRLLAVELQAEQMEYTLQLKAKQVKEAELQAEADKVRREKAAQAAANEQIIAAKAQEEAMRHVIPFKQKQVEQRQLEAEADKTSRIKMAEGAAQARRIEAAGEADSRQKLADAEVYRLEQIGKVSSTQLERDGALISRYPLLIQKTLADKLSDKISVIIAPPPADGGFIGNTLLGRAQTTAAEQAP